MIKKDVGFKKEIVMKIKQELGIRNAMFNPKGPSALILRLENIRIVIAPIIKSD